ncbi:MAG: imidazole glycerol phosphate synthase subunit HisH [Bacteroidales bacterium]
MIAIIDYGAGNIRSVYNAVVKSGRQCILTTDKDLIRGADKVIVPGVGEASYAMDNLRKTGLDTLIPDLRCPVLGICLGLQLMCRFSEEGETSCLGIFDTTVRKFRTSERIPHMGWNSINKLDGELFRDVKEGENMYFVHSYYAGLCESTIAVTSYDVEFSAALQKDNFYATQFHPEKSASSGELLLNNFLAL